MKGVEELLGTKFKLLVAVDSTDLFKTLSTCRLASNRSIRGDLSSIRFKFATKKVFYMKWVPRKTNLAEPGTKPDSLLTQTPQELLETACLPISFADAVILSKLSTG